MDAHSLDVLRGETLVAMIQWHPGRPPRVVDWQKDLGEFTLNEMRDMVNELTKRVQSG